MALFGMGSLTLSLLFYSSRGEAPYTVGAIVELSRFIACPIFVLLVNDVCVAGQTFLNALLGADS